MHTLYNEACDVRCLDQGSTNFDTLKFKYFSRTKNIFSSIDSMAFLMVINMKLTCFI